MDKNTLRQEIEHHEGRVEGIYDDSLGFKTAGIGHRLLPGEEHLDWGDAAVVDRAFETDLNIAIGDARTFCEGELESFPEDVQHVIVGLAFNLGLGRLLGFKRFRAALMSREWERCAAELVDSRWYTQTGRRARDYVGVFRRSAQPDARDSRLA